MSVQDAPVRGKPCAVGVDLGGTDVKIGLVGRDYALLKKIIVPTPAGRGAEQVAQEIGKSVRALLVGSGLTPEDLAGVGVACPGIIDGERGNVVYSNNFHWENVPLRTLLQKAFSVPLAIRNDAVCAGVAEWKAGRGAGCTDLVMLTLGTGVGSCVIAHGRLLEGTGSGGIAGHLVIRQNGRLCTCGKRGCLEAYASGPALARTARERLEAHPYNALWELCGGDPRKIDAKMVFAAAQAGDAAARAALEAYTDALAAGIGGLIDLFRPQRVLLGGGLSQAGDQLLSPLRRKVPAYCYAGDYLPPPPIEAAALRNSAGIVGAAALVLAG